MLRAAKVDLETPSLVSDGTALSLRYHYHWPREAGHIGNSSATMATVTAVTDLMFMVNLLPVFAVNKSV